MIRKLLVISQLLIACSIGLKAQVSVDIEPMSVTYDQHLTPEVIPTVSVPGMDWEQIAENDAREEKNGGLYKISRKIPVDYTLENSGLWRDVPGGKIWQMKIKSENAAGINLYYNDFFIPEGGMVHVYNPDKSFVLGAFTSQNNKEYGSFATSITQGDETIIEYFEPDYALGGGRIDIGHVNHIYRGLEIFEWENGTQRNPGDTCEVDVNCEEGDNWRNEIKGVVRILVSDQGFTGWCSGSMINNTAEDCTPYVLSAHHCAETSTAQDFNNFLFYFNYEKSGCGSGTFNSTNSISGCTLAAESDDQGGDLGSDYILVELSIDVPWGYNTYFNGWDANTTAATSGVGIHHPAGCVKKISTFTSPVLNGGWGISGTHWRVQWVATTNGHGVTEGGSSGSPLFNQDKLIVGQLTGGASFCSSPNDRDRYGKMSYNWGSNPGDNLSDFLDPINSGDLTMQGRFYPCANSIDEVYLEESTKVYPNPTDGVFTFEMKTTIDRARVELYNGVGQLVMEYRLEDDHRKQMDLSDLPSGIYYLNVYSGSAKATKRIIKH